MVRLLFDHGADIMAVNNAGWTPLDWAAEQGHIEVVKTLLDSGADITMANIDEQTPSGFSLRKDSC